MSKPELHVWYQRVQLARLDEAMAKMLRERIPITSTPFKTVWEVRAKLQLNIGYRLPRSVFSLLSLFGLSPGSLTLWLDAEVGWLVEARQYPGAPPVYHYVGDEEAIAILKGELTKELEARLMTPDPYLGE